MQLTINSPTRIVASVKKVLRIVAEKQDGLFGIWPQRLDCVAALVVGVLVYETAELGERFWALNGGVLVKTGAHVRISVRGARGGGTLEELRTILSTETSARPNGETSAEISMRMMEANFFKRFWELHREK